MCTRVEQKVKGLKRELREIEQRIVETALAFNALAAQVDPPLEPMDVVAATPPPSPPAAADACAQPWRSGVHDMFMDAPTDCPDRDPAEFTLPYAPDPDHLTLCDDKGNAVADTVEAATLRTDVGYVLKK